MNPIHVRLLNQQLVAPQFETAAQVVSHFGAMQAQEYRQMRWAVMMRTRKFASAAGLCKPSCETGVALCKIPRESGEWQYINQGEFTGQIRRVMEKAGEKFKGEFDEGNIVRMHLLRGTWQLVTGEDYWWMLDLCGDKAERVIRGWMSANRISIDKEELQKIRPILENTAGTLKSATKEDFVQALAEEDIVMDDHRLSYHIRMAELAGVLCSGDLLPMKATYSLAEEKLAGRGGGQAERLPAAPARPAPIPREESLALLTRKYFQSHSPATFEDFLWWTGLSISDCRQGIAALATELQKITWRGYEFYLHESCRTRGFHSGQTLLLPAYDEYLIGYKTREIALPPEFRDRAHNNSGIFYPIVARDGVVCGNWSPFVKAKA